MSKIRFMTLLVGLLFTFSIQTVFAKGIRGPNVSAIYKIEAIAQQLPELGHEQQLLLPKQLTEEVQMSFQRLFDRDKDLAVEVGRLPAFQKDISKNDELALYRFTELFENATPGQKANLASLLRIGLPQSRRYSAPLEAILWAIEKEHGEPSKRALEFPLEALLDMAWDFSDRTRWGDYEVVTDRLNAPELVNYYQRIALVYESKKGKAESSVGDTEGLFAKGAGNCYDHSYFAAYCLEKAGYKTAIVGVHPSRPEFHVVCQYEVDGTTYHLDNGRPDKFLRRGIIPKNEYSMYHEKGNIEKGKATKDPIYLLQDNHGLALIYLMDQPEPITNVNTIAEVLGISGYAEKVRSEYMSALVKDGFIMEPKRFPTRLTKDFDYKLDEALCERFRTERYHRPENAAAKW